MEGARADAIKGATKTIILRCESKHLCKWIHKISKHSGLIEIEYSFEIVKAFGLPMTEKNRFLAIGINNY